MDAPGEKYVSIACNSKYKKQLILLSRISLFTTFTTRGVARIFQRGRGGGGGGGGGGHRGYSLDYIWCIPLLSLVYQRARSYYRGMRAHIN